MNRFDRLQAQVENLEARVRSYEVGGPSIPVWGSPAEATRDPLIEEELEKLKQRVAGSSSPADTEAAKAPAEAGDAMEDS